MLTKRERKVQFMPNEFYYTITSFYYKGYWNETSGLLTVLPEFGTQYATKLEAAEAIRDMNPAVSKALGGFYIVE